MIIYIDMDGVICNYQEMMTRFKQRAPWLEFPQTKEDFWTKLNPIPGAINAVNELRKLSEVYILTAPSVKNPSSYSGKRIWIEKYFDESFCHKLIICPNKGLLKGDLLIDDNLGGKGQESFNGRLLKFGFGPYLTWDLVLRDVKTLINNLKK